jgi:hypothetical protein
MEGFSGGFKVSEEGVLLEQGHVAEWFNAPYLKYDVPRYHEFESHLVRISSKIIACYNITTHSMVSF